MLEWLAPAWMTAAIGDVMDARSPALFVADAPGLDFLNSVATPVDTPVDWIANGDGLLDWLEQARLVPPTLSRRCGHKLCLTNSTG